MLKPIALAVSTILGTACGAIACPDYNAAPQASYQATGQQLYTPRAFDVVAGGSNYIWDCPNVRPGSDTGAEYFPTAPDFSFQLSNMNPYRLELRVVSECDAALLINTASANWYYDDDDNGNPDPKITLTRPANGRVDIWIGTYDGEFCNARLELETFDR
jgi:hypothetical protein